MHSTEVVSIKAKLMDGYLDLYRTLSSAVDEDFYLNASLSFLAENGLKYSSSSLIINSQNWTEYGSKASLQTKSETIVEYFIITRNRTSLSNPIYVGNLKSLQESGFNPIHPTRVIVHGWIANRTSPIYQLLPPNYHRIGDFNIVVVDWGKVAWNYNYLQVRLSARMVGTKIAQFLDFLCIQGKTDPRSIYLIGHSQGAHTCGIAARLMKAGRIGVIIGLDTSGPFFFANDKDRLRTSDALYVQTIHSSDILGTFDPIGQASFYLNGGRQQPTCGNSFGCAHNVILDMFAESILGGRDSFPSMKCSQLRDVDRGKCTMSGRGPESYMGGEPVDTSAKGVYYVKTNTNKPFGVTKKLSKMENKNMEEK